MSSSCHEPCRNAAETGRLHARRQELWREALAAGAGALAVFGQGSALGAGTVSHGGLRYLTGWDGYESAALLVMTAEATCLLVASPFMAPLARTRLGPQDIAVLAAPPAQWGEAIAARLGGGALATAGFAEMPLAASAGLAATVAPQRWVDVSPALERMRLVKDGEALRRHRDAAALCDELFARLGPCLHAGRPAWQVMETLESHARLQGAGYCRTWLTAAPCADYPRYWRDECRRVPERGDQLLFGVMLTIDGHWGHGVRMGALGAPAATHRRMWRSVRGMLDAGLAALRVGALLGEAEAAMEARLRADHDAAEIARMQRFRNGHGLGLSYEEPLATQAFPQHFGAPGTVAPGCDVRVAPGMVLELHPNLALPDVGAAVIGEMVEIAEDGPRCLLTAPPEPVDWLAM